MSTMRDHHFRFPLDSRRNSLFTGYSSGVFLRVGVPSVQRLLAGAGSHGGLEGHTPHAPVWPVVFQPSSSTGNNVHSSNLRACPEAISISQYTIPLLYPKYSNSDMKG